MTAWKKSSLQALSLPFPPLPSWEMQTALPIRPPAYAGKFAGRHLHHGLTGGIGHNLPQEAPEAFADAIIEAVRLAD